MGRNSNGKVIFESDLIKIFVATLMSGEHRYWEEYCKREEVRMARERVTLNDCG